MNKKILVGLTFVLIGCVLMVTAFLQDGFPGPIYWNNGPVYLSAKDEKGEIDLTPDQITSGKQELSALDVSVKNADVLVKSGDHFAVVTDKAEKANLTVSSADGLVKITSDDKPNWTIGLNNLNSHKIVITVPEKTTLKKLALANINGDLTIQNQKVNQLLLDEENGDIRLSDSKVLLSGSVENRAGDTIVKRSTLPKLKTYSRYGDINVTNSYQNVPADQAVFSFRSSLGDISLT
ncbi:DUF4097 domain-containing protein [Fructobacillus sp. M1-13]|uniref:DUF4097 domain-containing protein n=1 Tax=Fructobacillus papyriferae TaxID=2713171 RepID=A0ABS5QNB0_9LACO|nr:DUF4097 family beta strand repeat-containing protein [Fructobacillus papyriferae]MBS9334481.1 DUF4097 domain-containing protein [Fructobacillus papyriferae]MCD2158470.1 DUF4097 domain-containing protein [Fructobacillus papyriferae]